MIRSDESKIVGNWAAVYGRVVGDDCCKRIELLAGEYLERFGTVRTGGDFIRDLAGTLRGNLPTIEEIEAELRSVNIRE